MRRVQKELMETKVDIIIPFYGQYQKVYSLLKSIWNGTKSNPYHIYLIDDCSPNEGFVTGFDEAPRTTVIRNESQLGFGGALEVGFQRSLEKQAKAEKIERFFTPTNFVLFMHSDCLIENANWLSELITTYMRLKDHDVGLVSARTNNPGAATDPRLKGEQKESVPDVILEEGCVPLYCALCNRSLFKQIGGFIKPYPYGWYEDEELALRMKRYGLKQAISGGSWVKHKGGATFRTMKNKIQDVMEQNRNQCIADLRALQQK